MNGFESEVYFTDFWVMSLKNIFVKKYSFHFLLWIFFVFALIADTTTFYSYNKWLSFYYVFAKTFVQASLVYVNILFLYPHFFKTKKYLFYIVFVLLITLIAGYCNLNLELFIREKKELLSREEHFQFFLSQLGMSARYVLISFLLKISVDYYEQKETIKKIELEKTTAELNFLKAQVNPHFLFNTLNNLYALILENSDKSGEAVLKLADIMKYTLAESKEDKVLLQKEILLLYNYTELERLRKPDAAVSFTVSGKTDKSFITPLLLLPLVENAFKYGLNSVTKNGFVRINIKTENKELHVTVENNIPPVKNNEAFKSLGIGIENVKRRLEILYPGKYVINIDSKTEVFFVQLQLQLS
ncbi:MAG: histidine kinase [Ferruginibacter sp.]